MTSDHNAIRAIMHAFEAQNRALHARYFSHLDFDSILGVRDEPDAGRPTDSERLYRAMGQILAMLQRVDSRLAEVERKVAAIAPLPPGAGSGRG